MIRKIVIVLVAIAAIGTTALAPSVAHAIPTNPCMDWFEP